jgi:hypothetical protein
MSFEPLDFTREKTRRHAECRDFFLARAGARGVALGRNSH